MGLENTKNALSATRSTVDVDWDRLEKAFSNIGIGDTIPDGSFTVEEYMEETGLSNPGARHRLNLLIKEGILAKSKGKRGRCHYYFVESE